MITNKDIRVENGNLVLNGDKFPLDGQSPEAIMEIVKDNSDTTPTENSTKPVKSGGIYSKIGDLTQTGVTGASVAAQIEAINTATHYEGNLNYSGHFDVYKYGRVVNLKITGVVNATLNETMSLTSSLPIAIRPSFEVDAVGYYNDTDYDASNNGVNFRIAPNGIISTYSKKAFTAGVLSVTYISAQ